MVADAMQGADQHIKTSFGFITSANDTVIYIPGEFNQWRPANKTLTLRSATPQREGDNIKMQNTVWRRSDLLPNIYQHATT